MDSARPTAYLLVGLPGNGKSTFSRQLETNGVVRVSVDAAMIVCHGRIGLDHRVEDHVRLLGPIVDEARSQVISLLNAGSSVVLDHGLGARTERDDWKAAVEAAGGRWRLVSFEADKATLLRRLARRSIVGDPESMPIDLDSFRFFASVCEPPVDEGEEPSQVTG